MRYKKKCNNISYIIFCVLLIFALILGNMEYSYAETMVTKDGQFQYTVIDNAVEITSYLGSEIDVTIPEVIDNIPVRSVGKFAFRSSEIKSVTGKSVEIIKGGAFYDCRLLENVNFPNVQQIDESILEYYGQNLSHNRYYGAFGECETISELRLPRVKIIKKFALLGCRGLKNIYCPSLEKVENYTFAMDRTPIYGSSSYTVNSLNVEKIFVPCSMFIDAVGYDRNVCCKSKFVWLHNILEWEIITEATCEKEGERQGFCAHCGKEKIEVIPTAHKYSIYKYNNDAQIGIDGTETASCDFGCGTTDTRTKVGSALSSGGSSGGIGGGGYLPPTSESQKPTITETDSADVVLDDDGTTATIKVKDGYELVDVLINGVSKGAVTALSGLKTGDVIEIKTKLKETTPTVEQIRTQLEKVSRDNFKARSKQVKLKSGKKAIKITWINSSDVKFDGVQIFRSTKKNSGYGKKPIYTSKSDKFYNTSIKKGKRYYYKVRGYIELDGVKYYSAWSTKAWRTVK